MSETNIASGMRAWERHEWAIAYEQLLPLLDAEESEPEHLEALAESAWWCGNLDDTIAARERAFRTYSEASRNIDAARLAVDLAEHHALRLQPSAARGWLARASRLLQDEPPTPTLGNLRRLEAVFAADTENGLQEARELASQVEQIGRDTGDRDVEVLGLHDQGRFSIAAGDVDRGMALMEDLVAERASPRPARSSSIRAPMVMCWAPICSLPPKMLMMPPRIFLEEMGAIAGRSDAIRNTRRPHPRNRRHRPRSRRSRLQARAHRATSRVAT